MTTDPTPFRVSVIIPAYNAARYLAETLESVLAQTVAPHEILVIDDGSTDATPAITAKYAPRVTYLHQQNRGVSAARNNAIGQATGNWIAFLDSDDLWEKQFIERVRPVCLSEPRPALVFTDYRTFGTANQEVRTSEVFAKWNSTTDVLAPAVTVMPSASLVPADTPIRFPEWARNDEDAIFFNEVSELGPVRCVAEVLMNYRKHPASAMAKVRNELIGFENLLRWAKGREAEKPGTVQRLMHSFAQVLINARWRRNWVWYWKLRGFCIANWPEGVPQPPILSERIWPPMVYRVKDMFDRARGRKS